MGSSMNGSWREPCENWFLRCEPCGEPRHRMIGDAMEELSYPVVSDAVRRTPSIYTRTVRVKNASNECELLESLDAPPEDRPPKTAPPTPHLTSPPSLRRTPPL